MTIQTGQHPPTEIRAPAGVRVLETGDFDRMAQAFVRWDHRFDQLSPGSFRGTLRFADFQGVQLFDCQANQIIRCQGSRARDSYTFSPVQLDNAGSLWRGRILRPGHINVAPPSQETDHRTSRDYRHTAITIHKELLERVSLGLVGVGLDVLLPPGTPVVEQHRVDHLVAGWRATLNPIGPRSATDAGAIWRSSHILDQIAQLVRALAAGRITDPTRLTSSQRLRVVRQAEEFATSNPPAHVTILALCELTGVSERGLHYAFTDVTGLSPKAFLKTLRLNQARRELLQSEPARGRIAVVAAKYGFLRPGEFAADFRGLFGALPSELHRRP